MILLFKLMAMAYNGFYQEFSQCPDPVKNGQCIDLRLKAFGNKNRMCPIRSSF